MKIVTSLEPPCPAGTPPLKRRGIYPALTVFLLLFGISASFAQTDFLYTTDGKMKSYKIRKDKVLLQCRPETDRELFFNRSVFTSAFEFIDNLMMVTIDTLHINLAHLKRMPEVTDAVYALEYEEGTLQMPSYNISIKMKAGHPVEEVLKKVGLDRQIENITLSNPHREIYRVKLNLSLENIFPICRKLYETGWCQFAEPYFIRTMQQLSNPNFDPTDNPKYKNQWGLKNTGQLGPSMSKPGVDINVVPAWNITLGDSVIVAIFDGGVDLHHEDLEDNILHEWCYDATCKNDVEPGSFSYKDYHGTYCAGVIGAVHNHKGMIGVAPNCKMVSVRIGYPKSSSGPAERSGPPYGTDHDWLTYDVWIEDAIIYAYDTAKVDILSNSWGGKDQAAAITAAFEDAATLGRGGKGCVIVAGTGNKSGAIYYPAALPYVIAVASINPDGIQDGNSNYGDELDVRAPGVNILTTTPDTVLYNMQSGSSFACPHVAGIVALMLSVNPCLPV